MSVDNSEELRKILQEVETDQDEKGTDEKLQKLKESFNNREMGIRAEDADFMLHLHAKYQKGDEDEGTAVEVKMVGAASLYDLTCIIASIALDLADEVNEAEEVDALDIINGAEMRIMDTYIKDGKIDLGDIASILFG